MVGWAELEMWVHVLRACREREPSQKGAVRRFFGFCETSGPVAFPPAQRNCLRNHGHAYSHRDALAVAVRQREIAESSGDSGDVGPVRIIADVLWETGKR